MIISFIIPVYNTEQYIEKCLFSIIDQNIPIEEYEIIVVDDGSSDNSPKLLANFAARYSQIKLITQENRGQGAARNHALREAKGDYIFFVDSDDYILPNTMICFLEFIDENSDTDIVCFNTLKEINGETHSDILRPDINGEKITGEEYLSRHNLYSGPCSSVFRRLFLIDHLLFMPEGIFHEDEIFSLKAYVYAEAIRFYNYVIYVNVKREGSTTAPINNEQRIKLNNDLRFVVRELHSFSKEENLSRLQSLGIERRMTSLVIEIIINLTRTSFDNDYCEETLNELIALNLFPLSPRNDSWKYELFRFVFKTKRRTLLVLKLRLIKFYRFELL